MKNSCLIFKCVSIVMLTLIALTCLVQPLCPYRAYAAETSTEWVRITKADTPLYTLADMQKIMFLLQKSYYLQVIDQTESMWCVTIMQNEQNFPQIVGYVEKSEVEVCTEEPIPPYYPTETLTVNTDCVQLKLTPSPSAETCITATNTQKISYYGAINSYGEWYYVYFCGKFGYVPSDGVTKPVIALHPTPLTVPVVTEPGDDEPTQPTTPPETTDNNGGNATEIILIVFVALLALGICLALFLPGNRKKKDIFDEDI